MWKKNLLFVLFVAVVVGLLWSVSGTRAPYIPGDADHRSALDGAPAACRACHAPGRVAPLGEKHPPKEPCRSCHKVKGG